MNQFFGVLMVIGILWGFAAIAHEESQPILVLADELADILASEDEVTAASDSSRRCDGTRYENGRGVFSCEIKTLAPFSPGVRNVVVSYYGDTAEELGISRPIAQITSNWGGPIKVTFSPPW